MADRERDGNPADGRRLKAVGLISGGLDSTLAARMLREQGIEVTGVNFSTGFCKVDHRRAVGRRKDSDSRKLRNEALRAGVDAGIPVDVVDVAEEFLEVVTNPRHGYGKAANPCIDCRIFMLRKAREYAEAVGAEIVFTGEVLGQRPMSQHRRAMQLIEREAGLEGRLLRPLSARLFAPTEAERRGELRRDALGALSGRSRKGQLELAGSFGLDELPQPGGGCCFLADRNFARRFRDLLAHKPEGGVTTDDILLLKVGRQFRLSARAKAVVGRDEPENLFLRRWTAGRWTLEASEGGSPLTVVDGEPDDPDLQLAARITARYSDQRDRSCVRVRVEKDGEAVWRDAEPAGASLLARSRL